MQGLCLLELRRSKSKGWLHAVPHPRLPASERLAIAASPSPPGSRQNFPSPFQTAIMIGADLACVLKSRASYLLGRVMPLSNSWTEERKPSSSTRWTIGVARKEWHPQRPQRCAHHSSLACLGTSVVKYRAQATGASGPKVNQMIAYDLGGFAKIWLPVNLLQLPSGARTFANATTR